MLASTASGCVADSSTVRSDDGTGGMSISMSIPVLGSGGRTGYPLSAGGDVLSKGESLLIPPRACSTIASEAATVVAAEASICSIGPGLASGRCCGCGEGDAVNFGVGGFDDVFHVGPKRLGLVTGTSGASEVAMGEGLGSNGRFNGRDDLLPEEVGRFVGLDRLFSGIMIATGLPHEPGAG